MNRSTALYSVSINIYPRRN